ncbi:MAG: hypothetical protein K0R00_231 [Herbinix sp.]|jgi:hypothetical protein|nr:hypothetical protein [Herbinix sp.]
MSKLVSAKCKKCGNYLNFDIGNMDKEEAENSLKAIRSWQCSAGNHVELMSPFDLYEFDWDNITENEPVTEEQFQADLKEKFKEVYSSDEFGEAYSIDSFALGKCLCHPRNGDEDSMIIFDFIHGPSGKRYYISML